MSAHKYTIRLSIPAQEDVRDILLFTLGQWGEKQLASYRRVLDAALVSITKNPKKGLRRHGCLVYPAGKHRIFYNLKDKIIYVLRILHERMDPSRHLTGSSNI